MELHIKKKIDECNRIASQNIERITYRNMEYDKLDVSNQCRKDELLKNIVRKLDRNLGRKNLIDPYVVLNRLNDRTY